MRSESVVVAEGQADQVGDAGVGDRVDVAPAVLVGVNQVRESEYGQVLAHGGHGLADGGREGADVALALREQQLGDLQTRGGREHAEEGRGVP